MEESILIDIHSHLGIKHNDVFTLMNRIVELDNNDYSFFSAGIHPWYIDSNNLDKQIIILRKLAVEKNCLAIGECGLDKLKGPDAYIQEKVFLHHLLLATELNKPIIIHNVQKTHRIIELITKNNFKGKIIFHGVNTKPEKIIELSKNNQLFFSFGNALFNENSNASKLIKILPLNKFFLETDDASVNIIDVYKQAIKLLNIDKEKFICQLQQNFNFVFNYGSH
jgi:TatD DNase family protein